jgi:hypothetical protein
MTKSIVKQRLDQDTALATRGGHCGSPRAQAGDSLGLVQESVLATARNEQFWG